MRERAVQARPSKNQAIFGSTRAPPLASECCASVAHLCRSLLFWGGGVRVWPAPSRNRTMSPCPFAAAACKGVAPQRRGGPAGCVPPNRCFVLRVNGVSLQGAEATGGAHSLMWKLSGLDECVIKLLLTCLTVISCVCSTPHSPHNHN